MIVSISQSSFGRRSKGKWRNINWPINMDEPALGTRFVTDRLATGRRQCNRRTYQLLLFVANCYFIFHVFFVSSFTAAVMRRRRKSIFMNCCGCAFHSKFVSWVDHHRQQHRQHTLQFIHIRTSRHDIKSLSSSKRIHFLRRVWRARACRSRTLWTFFE